MFQFFRRRRCCRDSITNFETTNFETTKSEIVDVYEREKICEKL